MISITIGGSVRQLGEADATWVSHEFAPHRPGQNPCVRVSIDTRKIKIDLHTPTCGPAGGGGHYPNAEELEVIKLWEFEGLNTPHFTAQRVADFVERLQRLL